MPGILPATTGSRPATAQGAPEQTSIEAGDMANPNRPRWQKRLRRGVKSILTSVGNFQARHALVPDRPWFDPRLFPWTAELEANAGTIRRELDAVLTRRDDLPEIQELQRAQYAVSVAKWKAFMLYGWGYQASEGKRLCPETTRLVENIPGLRTAFFSMLEPGAHIPEHRGRVRSLLRGQLALIVPRDGDKCTLWVAGEPHHWQEGRMMVFDDTYPHEVRNDTDEYRVVLLLHFDRPMRPLAQAIHEVVLFAIRRTSFVTQARRDYAAWAARFRAQKT
jgi:aspartyl/asparaginyl beta-hydroxylase (cupin superfamily)